VHLTERTLAAVSSVKVRKPTGWRIIAWLLLSSSPPDRVGRAAECRFYRRVA